MSTPAIFVLSRGERTFVPLSRAILTVAATENEGRSGYGMRIDFGDKWFITAECFGERAKACYFVEWVIRRAYECSHGDKPFPYYLGRNAIDQFNRAWDNAKALKEAEKAAEETT